MPRDAIERGAYVLRESYKGAEPDLILIGTGSEVHICLAAADMLEADGIATRVVSAPCMDRFAEQDEAYRDEVLPPAVRARVAVEAAATLGWDRWVGDGGAPSGMTAFGASGPAEGPLRALRLHGRRRLPSTAVEGGRSWMSVHSRRQRAARRAHGGGHQRLARPDPAQPDRVGGELERLVDEDSLRGVTSNPAIFEKAILGSDDYDDELKRARRAGPRREARSTSDIAIKDVQLAADVLRPV